MRRRPTGGAWHGGKTQNENAIVHNQTDLVDISSWFIYSENEEIRYSFKVMTFFLNLSKFFGQNSKQGDHWC